MCFIVKSSSKISEGFIFTEAANYFEALKSKFVCFYESLKANTPKKEKRKKTSLSALPLKVPKFSYVILLFNPFFFHTGIYQLFTLNFYLFNSLYPSVFRLPQPDYPELNDYLGFHCALLMFFNNCVANQGIKKKRIFYVVMQNVCFGKLQDFHIFVPSYAYF